jgi:hypothetical protein
VRLPPALAATATDRILELLGPALPGPDGAAPPRPVRVLELGFAGIHAEPLRVAGFEVVVVEPDPDYLERARERAGSALAEPPETLFDAVIAPGDADLAGVRATRALLVARDGSVTERR